jgi:excisionase family DNA binding protein
MAKRCQRGATGMTKLTYSVEEAAQALSLGRNTVYEAVRCGQIPAIRVGRRVLIPAAALERWLAEASQQANGAADGDR